MSKLTKSFNLELLLGDLLNESRKFLDVNKFKSLDDIDQQEYLKNNAEVLGVGSSRVVFLIDSSKVLKYAFNDTGVSQNATESQAYTNPGSKDILAKIYDHDSEFRWLISEIVRELKTEAEFKDMVGMELSVFSAGLIYCELEGYDLKKAETYFLKTMTYQDVDIDIPKAKEFFVKIYETVIAAGISSDDFGKLEHYGKTADNRIVILDYGFDIDVYKQHYDFENYPKGRFSDEPVKNVFKDEPEEEDPEDSKRDINFENKRNLTALMEDLFAEGRKFLDFNKFKSLSDEEQQEHLLEFGELVASPGSSRAVFLINSSKVLKYGYNDPGVAQNLAEIDTYTNPGAKNVVSKIYDYATDGRWVVSELVRKIESLEEFEELSGIELDMLMEVLEKAYDDGLNQDQALEMFDTYFSQFESQEALADIPDDDASVDHYNLEKGKKFFADLYRTVQAAGLNPLDFDRTEQWGKTASGKLVILDYGFSEAVEENYYTRDINKHQNAGKKKVFEANNNLSTLMEDLFTEGRKFLDINEFKGMADEEQQQYLKAQGEVVGTGTSRIVFLADNSKVLKYAFNDAGMAQNNAELQVYTNPNTKNIVSAIFDYSDDGRWLVSELVRPLKSRNEFEELAGASAEIFSVSLENSVKEQLGEDEAYERFFKAATEDKARKRSKKRREPKKKNEPEQQEYIAITKPKITLKEAEVLFRSLYELMTTSALLPGDFDSYRQWGKTSDNRLVLLDYGFDIATYKQFYKAVDGKKPSKGMSKDVFKANAPAENPSMAKTAKL